MIIAVGCITAQVAYSQQKFAGSFSNGYKGAKLSFVLSADKKTITGFTFNGYWRCAGSTEHIVAGPQQSFPVNRSEVHAVIKYPENGGASAFRFNIKGTVKSNTASGTFRMSITGLSCDTYLLNWTAKPI